MEGNRVLRGLPRSKTWESGILREIRITAAGTGFHNRGKHIQKTAV